MTDIVELFEANTLKLGLDECWPWKGSVHKKDNRGVIWIKEEKKNVVAPRLSWRVATGEWPSRSLLVCHSCDNPNCVNPNHLWLGTVGDNARDAASKGRLATQKNPSSSFFSSPASNEYRPRGQGHGRSLLSDDQVKWIRENYRPHHRDFGARAMSRKFGVHHDTVEAVIHQKTWRHV